MLKANPGSGQALRDVLVSLERMVQAQVGRADGNQQALEFQLRSLQIALQLREQNPTSWFHHRTAAVSFIQTYQIALKAGNSELANQCLADCYSVLHPLAEAGSELDPEMLGLYRELAQIFEKSGG